MYTHLGARIAYCAYFCIFVALALYLRASKPQVLRDLDSMQSCSSDTCVSKALVYRVTFSMFSVFLLHSVVMALLYRCAPTARASFQRGYWGLKIFIMFIWLVACMFISNDFYEKYVFAATIGGAIFIFLQILLLLEFAYAWNEKWVTKGEEVDQKWFKYILMAAAVLYIAGITLVVFEFKFFTQNDNCDLTTIFIIATVVLGIIFTVISLKMERGILPPAVIWFYCAQMTWSACMSQPNTEDQQCNSLSSSTEGTTWQLILGLGFTVVAVAYKAQKAATQQDVVMGTNKRDAKDFGEAPVEGEEKKGDEAEPEDDTYNYSYFHLVFGMGCMYIAMLMTQWGVGQEDIDSAKVEDNLRIDSGETSMWVNISSVWITAILFIWTLVAPAILKDREF